MSPTMEGTAHFSRLLSREDAARRCVIERLRGGVIVFTNGVFDILHRGHLEYLREARQLGTMLIVGLNSDDSVRRIKGSKRPLVSEEDRAMALSALRFVDGVVLFDEDTPEVLIRTLNPHVLVKGGDYRAEDVVGYDHVTRNGGRVQILRLREGYSTSGFVRRITERFGG
ncbi:D-glycero-beta-D-manno-heptose 1-phosphate adenylyltransferase [bacterium]|nr:D-glycero-beta-D-manno-heptose 1-phosphate adenylyltransferase [bacterium]MBU1985132.1 D-glycero-beta-D-manno-heptose 1-phosphate adenylyltransferase [bacterium]